MKDHYDFSNAKRGALTKRPARRAIRIDADLIDWFRDQVPADGGNYVELINEALRAYVDYSGCHTAAREDE